MLVLKLWQPALLEKSQLSNIATNMHRTEVVLSLGQQDAHLSPLLRSLTLDLVYGLTRFPGRPGDPPK